MNKKFVSLITGVLMLSSILAQTAWSEININLLGAQKQLSSDWKPNDLQDEIGVDADIGGSEWPISINAGYLFSTKKGTGSQILTTGGVTTAYDSLKRESTTEEQYAGLKKIWNEDMGNCFLSAGAAWIKGKINFTDVISFDDSKMGWYASAGLYWTLLKMINLGVFARYSDTKLTLVSREINAGGWHYGVLAGLHF